MKFTRGKRITFELLGPPLLGAILLFACAMATVVWNKIQNGLVETFSLKELLGMGIAYLGFAYFFAGIPAIVYTFIMEWRFARAQEPDSWQTVRFSAFLGAVAGTILGLALNEFHFGSVFWLMGGIGLAVGFLLGLVIKHWSTEQ